MALLIKNVTTYQKTKPLYEAYRKARNKEKYQAEHERGIILHEFNICPHKKPGCGGYVIAAASRLFFCIPIRALFPFPVATASLPVK